MTAPTLVFAWGNPARGDDALGPLFATAVEAWQLPGVECLTDFQLQVEHALDLQGRQRVLFVDASLSAPAPFGVQTLAPLHDESFSSHAMSPAAILQVYCDVLKRPPPPAQLLAIQGVQWELGIAPSATARENLAAVLAWAKHWLASDTAAGTAQAPT